MKRVELCPALGLAATRVRFGLECWPTGSAAATLQRSTAVLEAVKV